MKDDLTEVGAPRNFPGAGVATGWRYVAPTGRRAEMQELMERQFVETTAAMHITPKTQFRERAVGELRARLKPDAPAMVSFAYFRGKHPTDAFKHIKVSRHRTLTKGRASRPRS
jgi:hypothetical protein